MVRPKRGGAYERFRWLNIMMKEGDINRGKDMIGGGVNNKGIIRIHERF